MNVTVEPRQQGISYVEERELLKVNKEGRSGKVIATCDPFTGAVIAEVPSVRAEDVNAIVARAAEAQAGWAELAAHERAAVLVRMAELIQVQHDELAALESLDAGKLYAGTRGWDVGNARDVLRFYAEHGPAYLARVEQYERAFSMRQPVGVVASLAPWNAPLAVGVWKLAPALMAGNSVVMKAPERAPLSTLALANLAVAAGIPDGVVNVLTGGQDVGAALVTDPGVAAVSFTGGSAIASEIVKASAGRLPRLLLELGGKNPNVVFADADLEQAAAGTLVAMFDVAGQNCCAGSRSLIQRSVYEDFLDALSARAAETVVGDQFDPASTMGPQIDPRHATLVANAVAGAVADGARLLCGGTDATGPNATCFPATIIEVISLSQPAWREETFGPVGYVTPFEELEDAVAISNDSGYGLSASVWSSSDLVLAQYAREVNVGVCWRNTFSLFDIGVPWGGTKRSGYGRELALATLDEYTQVKVIY